MKELEYEITNVAGVERAKLQLRPGVNILRGRNAIGKSSAMRAIVRAQGGEAELERRDGSDHGEVVGPGIRLRVGKVVRKTGEAELSLADTSPLSTLIDPGLKDSDAAARARVRALIDLLGVGVDDAALETLCQGDALLLAWLGEEIQAECIDDLMAAAEKLRHHVHGQARGHENQAEEMEGRGGAARDRCRELLEALGGKEKLVTQSTDDARTELDVGTRRHERAVALCEAREELEAQQAEIRGTLGERPDRDGTGLLESEADLADIDAGIEALRCTLAEAQQRRAAKQAEVKALEQRTVELTDAAKRWDEQQAILAKVPEGPNRERLPALEAEFVGTAQAALDLAQRSEVYRVAEAERLEAETAREREAAEALRLRHLAASLPARLGVILAAAGAKGLTVVDGRLHAILDDKTLDYERRLSDGQRVKVALDVAAQAYSGVVPLAGSFWASLDPANRAEFAAMAQERELYVMTEEPADGELRVDHLGVDGAVQDAEAEGA